MTGCGTGAAAGSTTCGRNEAGAAAGGALGGGPLSGPAGSLPAGSLTDSAQAADQAAARAVRCPRGERPGFSRREFLGLLAALPAAAGLSGCVLGLGGGGREPFAFGVIADAQYCDYEPAGTRYYRASLEKLPACVKEFNALDLEFVIHLGDFIDRDFASFARFLPLYDALRHPHHHVLGNHDFAVAGEKKAEVPAVLGMPGRYYDFACRGWRFVVLDGNDVSLHGNLPGTEKYKRAMAMLEKLSARRARNARPWNGAIGEEQIAWLKGRLAAAEAAGERAVLFCHFPLFPPNDHNLWNDEEMMRIVEGLRQYDAAEMHFKDRRTTVQAAASGDP